MYRKQVKWQKILCFVALISAVLLFVYALGIMTDLYDALYQTIRSANKLDQSKVTGSRIYYDMQNEGFNKLLLYFGIGMILLAVLLFVCRTNSRRKYYFANYLSTGLFSVAGIACAVWVHIRVEYWKNIFQTTINFEELAEYAAKNKTLLLTADSTFWFDIHYLVSGMLIIASVALIANLIWKKKLEKDEKSMIGKGKEALA